MASNTKQSKSIRKRKRTKQGKERKRRISIKGTTMPFPIHKDGKSKS